MRAYSDAISNCSTEAAPWAVIPADNKWMRDLIISQIVVEYMEGLKMEFPKPSVDIEKIRKEYFREGEPSHKKQGRRTARAQFNPK